MKREQLDIVVDDVYRKTYELWESVRDRLAKDDHGFKILYTPSRLQPAVLVIGLQPGGDAAHMRDEELRHPSANNEYLSESWPLAAELRKRFGASFLQDAVGINAVYFRAPGWTKWQSIHGGLRTQLEAFCVGENKRLIRAMRPKRILLLGWDALNVMGGTGFREEVAIKPVGGRRRRNRLLQSGQLEGIPAFAIPHPSAAWKNPPVTDVDWEMILAGITGTSPI